MLLQLIYKSSATMHAMSTRNSVGTLNAALNMTLYAKPFWVKSDEKGLCHNEMLISSIPYKVRKNLIIANSICLSQCEVHNYNTGRNVFATLTRVKLTYI